MRACSLWEIPHRLLLVSGLLGTASFLVSPSAASSQVRISQVHTHGGGILSTAPSRIGFVGSYDAGVAQRLSGRRSGVRCVSVLNRPYAGSASGGTIARPGMTDTGISARSAPWAFRSAPGRRGTTATSTAIRLDVVEQRPSNARQTQRDYNAGTIDTTNAMRVLWSL